MLDNSIVSFIAKTPYKCLLYTGMAGLIAFQHPYLRRQSLKLIEKTQPVQEKLSGYYSFLLRANQNLWIRVGLYLNEHPQTIHYGVAVVSIAGATALIYRNRGEVKSVPISLIYFARSNLDRLRQKLILNTN